MAHFAEIDENNIVQRVIVISDEFDDNETLGESFCQNLTGSSLRWLKTSYNGNIRGNFAGIGSYYDEVRDIFILPKPYDKWILNETTWKWEPPIPYPTDGKRYWWVDELEIWVEY